MPEKPTIFFVHGAWHQSAHYDSIAARLRADGFPVEAPTQPTFDPPQGGAEAGGAGAGAGALPGLSDDAAFVRAEVRRLAVGEGRRVVVVMHSYGGVVGTEALGGSDDDARDLFLSSSVDGDDDDDDDGEGSRGGGGVIHLVYMAAFMPAPGASLGDAFGGGPDAFPPFIRVDEDGRCSPRDPLNNFYGVLAAAAAAAEEEEERAEEGTSRRAATAAAAAAAERAVELIRPHAARAQLQPVSRAAWLEGGWGVSYIRASRDAVLPPAVQDAIVAGAERARAAKAAAAEEEGKEEAQQLRRKISVLELESDHSPWLCREDEVVEFLESLG